MMLKKPLMIATIAAFGTLIGCSTPTEVTTRDGRTVTTPDKPKMDKDGFVTYKKDGKQTRVNRDEVESIEEVK